MLKKFIPAIAIAMVVPLVNAQTDPGPYKKADTTYLIYGGTLGDMTAPTNSDKKIAFSVEGKAARALFEAIGPDKKDACLEGIGARVRHRNDENLECVRSKEGEYRCSFGFDLRTGKAIAGSIC